MSSKQTGPLTKEVIAESCVVMRDMAALSKVKTEKRAGYRIGDSLGFATSGLSITLVPVMGKVRYPGAAKTIKGSNIVRDLAVGGSVVLVSDTERNGQTSWRKPWLPIYGAGEGGLEIDIDGRAWSMEQIDLHERMRQLLDSGLVPYAIERSAGEGGQAREGFDSITFIRDGHQEFENADGLIDTEYKKNRIRTVAIIPANSTH